MNLQEDIHRIHEIMGGVITEDDKTAKIHKMINDIGLFNTIKFFGGYHNIIDMFGGDINLTKEQKINFIREVIENLLNTYNSTFLSIYDLGMSPIRLYEPKSGQNLQQIEKFKKGFVTIDVYGGVLNNEGIGGYNRKYEDLSDEILNKVFIFMVEALQYHL
jgi:hypothetical protein